MPELDADLFHFDNATGELYCQGQWTVLRLHQLREKLADSLREAPERLTVNGAKLTSLDSAGALALHRALQSLRQSGKSYHLTDFSKPQKAMLDLIDEQQEKLDDTPPTRQQDGFFAKVGQETIVKLQQADGLIILIGALFASIFAAFGQWRRFHSASIIANVFTAGIQALPIIALLSFLIGIVLAYQMGLQLQTYGANIYIAFLSGMAIFREFSPLITAIIVAGRTSSAFTAQLGSMKVNEEIDALRTMGLSPVELLVVPKVFGLILVFPLLIFWSDIFAIFGAMVMSKFMLQVSYLDFLERVRDSVGLKQFMLGLYKAPFFALLIALVGCFQGFRVESNSDSIGRQTTKSVVQALFLIIIADAVFSIIYSWMGL
ncbi:MAG: MlaE family lipid ABC transporter permease subunit [Legionellaceae bacterium]|nr:MlaE family lipid ABC transporter permease subunit [Legionellaceae bacterium]